ncbi:MAG: response regulator transcription factor [Myxococcota bacterium]
MDGANDWSVLHRARILVVDDDAMAVRSLERVLVDQRAEVTCAMSADVALQRIQREVYDAAVVDYFLVGQEGRVLLKPLRDAATCSLMISGVEREEIARSSIASGADDFLLKPFEVADFLNAVARTVAKTREWRDLIEPLKRGQRPEPSRSHRPVLEAEVERIGNWLQTVGQLTDRERDVMMMVFMGRSNEEIAQAFSISESTVKYHDLRARRKLGVDNRRALTRMVFDGTGLRPRTEGRNRANRKSDSMNKPATQPEEGLETESSGAGPSETD